MNDKNSKGTDLLFSMDDSQYVVMTFIPLKDTEEMSALVSYRLVNKL